jgi:hypothetical protein
MANSTARKQPRKSVSDFPLTAHKRGGWAKKIKGRVRYIPGTREEALEESRGYRIHPHC